MMIHLRPIVSRYARYLSSCSQFHGPSFVFDIDGVLTRGGNPLPPGQAALKYLFRPEDNSWRAPVAFLTNGGGHTEAHRAEKLSSMFDINVDPEQVVLAHTPMQKYVEKYNGLSNHKIITVGPELCAVAARNYGFNNVISTARLAKAMQTATPFSSLANAPEATLEEKVLARMNTAAIFVMADSKDWGRDIQILIDILASDGSPDRVASDTQVVDLYFSNPDLTFPNEYHLPRLAGGSFRIALDAVFSTLTGRKLDYVQFGKPNSVNYELAERALRTQAHRLGFSSSSSAKAIFAVGDNPLSDVQGANSRGHPWISVLVRTGNFSGPNNDPDNPAHVVVDDAYAAVLHAFQQFEGERASMRC